MKRAMGRLALAAGALAGLATAAAAQIDYRNLDHGRPFRVPDAVAVERYAFELSLPWRYATGGGGSAHVLTPELEYGFARNLVLGLDLALVADGSGGLEESHAAVSLFYNARRETPGAPALSFELEVGQPTAADLLTEVAATVTGIASRSLGRSRLNASASLTAGGDEPAWFAGAAWDYTLYRTSTLVGGELLAEERPGGGARWALGTGLRRQLSPTFVLHAGIRRWLDDDPGATELTLGLSHAFAVAGFMPGRPR